MRETPQATRHHGGRMHGFAALPLLALVLFGCGVNEDPQARKNAVATNARTAAEPSDDTTTTTAPPVEPPSVPGRLDVAVERDPESDVCRVTWAPPADDGGSPLLGYVVTTESPPAPPADGVDIGSALQVTKTIVAVTDVPAGSSVTVAAENVVGAGPGVQRVCA